MQIVEVFGLQKKIECRSTDYALKTQVRRHVPAVVLPAF